MDPLRIDKYEILSPIGTGGMGRVYRARAKGPGGAAKQVALKVMHPHLADDDDFVKMFLDEMRVAMALSHRNIVQTFDAGKAEDHYFMVMELVEGGSLRQLQSRLAGKPLPLDLALFIGMELGAALDYAHRFNPEETGRTGVLHRDVSPSNVLLSLEGDVKLTDFGVAKAAGGHHVTQTNQIRGKLQYMAPEQAAGQAGAASDIFSLGAVLYELCSGQPVARPTAFEGLQQTRLPPPPSSIRASIPPDLDALLLRCLAPRPAQRLRVAAELRDELRVILFALQRQSGDNPDPHAQLQRFLVDQGLGQAATAAPPPAALAQAMLKEIRGLETDPDLGQAEQVFEVDSPSEQPTTVMRPDAPLRDSGGARKTIASPRSTLTEDPQLSPAPRGRGARLAAFLVIALALISGAALLLTRSSEPESTSRQPRPAAVSPAPDGPLTRPQDLGPQDATAPDQQLLPPDLGQPDAPLANQRRQAKAAPRHRRRLAHGSLDINSRPWARVYIDGRYRGITPLQNIHLKAGRHTVRLVSPKGAVTRKVDVTAGKRSVQVFELDSAAHGQ